MTRVAIIGGGPAGLMAAVLLARTGVTAVVIERKSWPIDKVCGEGIMPHGVELMQRVGLLQRIDPQRSRAYRGIRYVDPSGRVADGVFRDCSGLVVRRLALSEALLNLAQAEQLVELRNDCELVAFEETADGVQLDLRDLESGEQRTATGFDYLIGADGLRSRVRRLAHLEGGPGRAPGKQPGRMGARVHCRIPAWSDLVEVWWQDGVECYVAPSSEDCVEFNFGWDHDHLHPAEVASAHGSLERGLFSFFPDLHARVEHAERLSTMNSWGPLPHRAAAHLRGRVALIGDAGLFFDQITGEGISLAFLQAELLAQTLGDWHTLEGRRCFTDGIGKVADHYVRITGFAMFFTRHPRLRSAAIRFLARSPELFSDILHANMSRLPTVPLALSMSRHALQGLLLPAKPQPQRREQLEIGQ